MEDVVHPLDGFLHRLAVGDRALDELVLQSLEVFAVAAAQVVEHPHLRLPLEMLNNMATDKSGPAGY